jgi:predicted membrane protein
MKDKIYDIFIILVIVITILLSVLLTLVLLPIGIVFFVLVALFYFVYNNLPHKYK